MSGMPGMEEMLKMFKSSGGAAGPQGLRTPDKANVSATPQFTPDELKKMMPNAEHLWKFMDDLAEENPEEYQEFIKKQMEGAKAMGMDVPSKVPENLAAAAKARKAGEGGKNGMPDINMPGQPNPGQDRKKWVKDMNERALVDVEPVFVIKLRDVKGEKLFVNVCQSTGVGEPFRMSGNPLTAGCDYSDVRVPYCKGLEHEEEDKEGKKCIAYDFVYHPKAMSIANQDFKFKRSIVALCRMGVAQHFKRALQEPPKPGDVSFPKMKYKGKHPPKAPASEDVEIPSAESTATNDRGAYLDGEEHHKKDVLGNVLTFASAKEHEEEKKDEPEIELKLGTDVPAPAKPLIMEIGSELESEPSPSASTKERENNVRHTMMVEDGAVVVKMDVPNMKSAQEADLTISSNDLELVCENHGYYLHLDFPMAVDEDSCKAKLDKKRGVLKLTLPAL